MSARSLESYAHSTAKRLMRDWLREDAAAVGRGGFADFAGLTWRVNRDGPSWGIWDEYPILSDGVGADPVWDEVDDRWQGAPPSYGAVVEMGFRPACILDVAIQHKGLIAFGIEIKHKHACDARKLALLDRMGVSVIEIPAYWALSQVDRPSAIPAEFFVR